MSRTEICKLHTKIAIIDIAFWQCAGLVKQNAHIYAVIVPFCSLVTLACVSHGRSSVCQCDFIRFGLYFPRNFPPAAVAHPAACQLQCRWRNNNGKKIQHAVSADKTSINASGTTMDDGICIVAQNMFFSFLVANATGKNYEYIFFGSAIVAFPFAWIKMWKKFEQVSVRRGRYREKPTYSKKLKNQCKIPIDFFLFLFGAFC